MFKRGERFARGSGYSILIPAFDCETYSEAGFIWNATTRKWGCPEGANKKGLKVVGRRNYVLHPTFHPLSFAWNLLDGKGTKIWTPASQTQPEELIRHIESGDDIEAWNAGFEFDVWNLHCAPQYGWPTLSLEQLYCAMAKSRAFAYPGGLGDAGDIMKLIVKKDKAGADLLKIFSIPRNPTQRNPKLRTDPEDKPKEFQNLCSYNGTDVNSENEASSKSPDLSPEEREFWLVDQKINLRGIQVDLVAVGHCREIVLQAYEKYNAELRKITNGHVKEASKLPALKKWLGTQGIHVASLTEDNIDEVLAWPELTPAAKRALEIRQLLGSASIKKLFSLQNQQCNGRVYDLYTYFGARTGRWTANGPQPQNFPKGFLDNIEDLEAALVAIATRSLEYVELCYPGHTALEVVAACLRGLLIAAPGHDLICSDFSAIEGVVTAALAGEEWRLEVFRTHGLIYEAGASAITGIPFEEFVRHKRETGKHHPMRQAIGKPSELAGGFQGWVGAMIRFGADKFMDEKGMKDTILAWRAKSPMIVELWGGQSRGRFEHRKKEYYGLEGCGIQAVLNPGHAYGYRGIVYQYSKIDDVLFCRVPSGGFLTYHEPRLEPSTRDWAASWELELSYKGWNSNSQMGPIGWVRMKWYGGKATENVVQKEARAIQANALVNLERANYRPVIHSHDEIVGEVPLGWGSVEEFEAIANVLPAFARGWPIKMKGGWRRPRYGKFEE